MVKIRYLISHKTKIKNFLSGEWTGVVKWLRSKKLLPNINQCCNLPCHIPIIEVQAPYPQSMGSQEREYNKSAKE